MTTETRLAGKNRVRILNIDVDNISREELLQKLTHGLLLTPNVDVLMQLQENRDFHQIYKNAEYVTVDSQIVMWAARFLGRGVKEKISGSDFLSAYYMHHRHNPDVRIFLLGGKPGVAPTAAGKINARAGRRIVVGALSPSMRFAADHEECMQAVDAIRASGANVLVVGLGVPKQEIWITRYREHLPEVRVFMALGATLDFEAGSISRAPQWMSRYGLEWLYRLFQEPGRLWKRYLVRDPRFLYLVLKQRLGLYRSPF